MRQVWLTRPEQIDVKSVDIPQPGPGQMLVRTLQVGICGSDLHAYHGRHPFITLPVVPGHEAVGTVEAVGDDITEFRRSDQVILEPNSICGACEHCRSGRYNLCDNLSVVDCGGPFNGSMADYFVAPASRFMPADPRLSPTQATMVEPLATAAHAVRVAAGVAGKRVAVLGAGTIGLLTMQAARAAGGHPVVVTDLNPAKRRFAESLRAEATFDPADAHAVSDMRERLGGRADVVFDCVAIQPTMDQAIALALKGGTMVVVGVPEHDVRVPLALIQDREIRSQRSAMCTRQDMLEAMRLIVEGQVEVGSLVTKTLPRERAADAFTAADSGREVKVHLVP